MIFEKMSSCFWKLKLGFWSYGVIRLLGPVGPNIVSRPQTLRSIYFLRFQNFIELISWFCRKWGLFLWKLKLRFQTYGLIRFLDPIGPNVISRPHTQGHEISWNFMILLDSFHDSWENEVLFVKTGGRVLDLWFDMSSGPNWPKWTF